MLQIMKVGRSGKVMEKGMPNVSNLGVTIEALAVQGMFFEFWGGFANVHLFDELSVGPTPTNNLKNLICWAKGAKRHEGRQKRRLP